MPLLPQNEIEAEVSYAYAHAVAAAAGMGCQVASRPLDNAGVDARLDARDQFAPDSVLTDITLHVQLKATCRWTPAAEGRFSYALNVALYDKLRTRSTLPHRILVVMLLPANISEWVEHNEDLLCLKKCAYWVSLRGAPPTTNTSTVTIYVPQNQIFSPEGLHSIMTRLSKEEELLYAG